MPEANTREQSGETVEAKATGRVWLHALCVVAGYTLLFVVFFAPVLFSAYLLAPGDGILYFLPNFYARRVLWDESVWGGFPAVGDSQLMMWYPPALLFSLVKSWNAFLLSAYVLASSFAYAYAYALTRSRFAAAVGGVCYGMCGFLVAHLGHAALIHAAAWLPLFILSLEKLARSREDTGHARRFDSGDSADEQQQETSNALQHEDGARVRRAAASGLWYGAGALSVACAALAGHPQIFVYMLVLGGTYALVRGWRAGVGRVRYYFLCALMVLTGTGLAALQLWPTTELAAASLRASLGFADFVSYALPPRQIPMLLFPYLFGGSPGTLYDLPYFGAWGSEAGGWGAGELSGYVGLLPLLLAGIGFFTARRRTLAWFWLAVCTVAFLLALGDATPLARLTYRLPVINKFRVPARHFMELSLGVSVLAAFGAQAVLQRAASGRLITRTLIAGAGVMLACLALVVALSGRMNALATESMRRPLSFLPWANPATGVPLVVLLSGACALFYWHRRPHSFARGALLLFVLALDLASFTWFYEWHYGPPYKVFQSPPRAAVPLRDELAATHTRLLPVRGGTGRVSEIPPDLSKLWQFPSASGYGPFILSRTSRLLTMPPHGSVVDATWRDPANLGLDMLAVRYLFVPRDQVNPPAMRDAQGISWTQGEFNVSLGAGCGAPHPEEFAIELPRAVRANAVSVATALACSAAVADEAEVARLSVTDTRGQTYTQSLRAGRDTSEWAYDCADVRPTLKQSRAPIYRSYPVTRAGDVRCEGHDYAARLSLPATVEVKRIALEWTAGKTASLSLKKISLLDASDGTSTPVVPVAGTLADTSRWRHVMDINPANSGYGQIKPEDVGEASVYENLRARPRAWLVGKVLRVTEEEALGALHSSRLAGGEAFDPATVALVEEPFDFAAQALDASAVARVTHLSDGHMEVETRTSTPAFLVTSDVFYPGWEATVDDAPARLVRANYALRGLAVPAGTHRVRFDFRPRSFYRGATVSAVSLLFLAACVFWLKRKEAREHR
ncbi:MAG TPA: YfhO family protein [Pyrinomonadaceae bacterium]|nr:YfhO family protein [Pyrinomonadaceae bacterium]